jgi:hypothetical protein
LSKILNTPSDAAVDDDDNDLVVDDFDAVSEDADLSIAVDCCCFSLLQLFLYFTKRENAQKSEYRRMRLSTMKNGSQLG